MPSYMLLGIKRVELYGSEANTIIGTACSKLDLTTVHDMMVRTGYEDDEGTVNKVSCHFF